ncbi:NAD(P)-dependent oxidoreductase [Arcanobacterium hippocoleae]
MNELNVLIDPFWQFDINIPGVRITRWDLTGEAPHQADIVVTGHWSPKNAVAQAAAAGAKLLQISSIGFDALHPDVPSGLQVANAATVHETATSEAVLTALLAVIRDIPQLVRDMDSRKWNNFYSTGLADKKILLIGVGGVGQAVRRRLEPFEVELTFAASRERDEEYGHVYALDQVDQFLSEQDAVIVVIPANEQTNNFIDADFLSKMKDGAVLLNAGRGSLADMDALTAAGKRLKIVLDVANPEPLPAAHPIWEVAALITAHNGGNTAAMHPRMKALLERQINHALSGKHLKILCLEIDFPHRSFNGWFLVLPAGIRFSYWNKI